MKRNFTIKIKNLNVVCGVLIALIFFTISSCESGVNANKNITNNEDKSSDTSAQKAEARHSIDQEAVAIFKSAMDYLGNLDQFSVQVQSTLEDINESGFRVDMEIASSLVVNRPDKLRAERHSDLYNQVFYYNGSILTLHNPIQKVYASEPVPGTIEEMLHHARDTYGISAPASDLVYGNAFDLLFYEVSHAEIIGTELIGKKQCTHLLFSRPGVDFQIWIADEGHPLPYKYVVTDTSTPELLAFVTVMHKWDVTPKVTENMFNFQAPQGTYKIEFLEVN